MSSNFFENIDPRQILLSNCNDVIMWIDELPHNFELPLGREFTDGHLDLICTDALWVVLTAICEAKPEVETEGNELWVLKKDRDEFVTETQNRKMTLQEICEEQRLVCGLISIVEALVALRYRVAIIEITLRGQGVRPLEEEEIQIPEFDINALLENLNPAKMAAVA